MWMGKRMTVTECVRTGTRFVRSLFVGPLVQREDTGTQQCLGKLLWTNPHLLLSSWAAVINITTILGWCSISQFNNSNKKPHTNVASDGIFIFINWLIEHCFRTALREVMREHASLLHALSPFMSIHSHFRAHIPCMWRTQGHRCHWLYPILMPDASNLSGGLLLQFALIFALCRGSKEVRRWLL